MSEQNILDKSMRSVFVGNIPYEATEEKLKDIFNEVGPVISFKLVYDRETGKPKGYGFCEYKDQETALSAMRNLNGYEIGGRTLRVDNACTEKSRLEMQSLMMGMPTSENNYGDAVNAEKAPEVISNLVSNLPPEQLYDLMKQMKECIQNNPVEARNMLLQNPQLGYALLQAQVVMKILDPEVAKTMLYPPHKVPPPVQISDAIPLRVHPMMQMPNNNLQWRKPNVPMAQAFPQQYENMDWHMRMNHGHNMVPDIRQLPHQMSFPPPSSGMPINPHQQFSGLRNFPQQPLDHRNHPLYAEIYSRDRRPNNNFMSLPSMSVPPPLIPEQKMPFMPPRTMQPTQQAQQQVRLQQQQQQQHKPSDTDNKAALILQVLQLTDAQIAMLPAEQRQSIIKLKEKIAESAMMKN